MAFSVSPFSSIAFSDSGSREELVVLSGVGGTGQIGTGIDVRSIVFVPIDSLVATSSVGSVSVQGVATLSTTGVEGTVEANSVNAKAGASAIVASVSAAGSVGEVSLTGKSVVVPNSVQVTGSAGSLTVVADANFSIAGVSGATQVNVSVVVAESVVVPSGVSAQIITDDPLINGDEIVVDAEAVVLPNSNDGIAFIGVPTVVANANVAPTGVEADGIADDVTVEADSNTSVTGVAGTVASGSANVTAEAVVIPVSVVGSVAIGSPTITAVQFDYEAVKESYSRLRTDYVREADSRSRT